MKLTFAWARGPIEAMSAGKSSDTRVENRRVSNDGG